MGCTFPFQPNLYMGRTNLGIPFQPNVYGLQVPRNPVPAQHLWAAWRGRGPVQAQKCNDASSHRGWRVGPTTSSGHAKPRLPFPPTPASGGDSPMRLGCSGRRRRLLRAALLRLVVLVLVAPPRRCAGESATCLAVYREGGAPAVFQSAHCPRWTLLAPSAGSGGEGDGDRRSSSSSPPPPPHPRGCHVAVDRGRRRSQEDRAVCALGIRIPFIGIYHKLRYPNSHFRVMVEYEMGKLSTKTSLGF